MNPRLRVETTASYLFVFNPWKVVTITYNAPWSDDFRREYFLEYFFRSAFFGEFDHADALLILGKIILVLALCLLPIFFFGLVFSETKRGMKDAPLSLLFIMILLSQYAYRIHAPFAPNQDMRFSVLIIIPVAYYLTLGVFHLPTILRRICSVIAVLYGSAALLFLVLLPLFS